MFGQRHEQKPPSRHPPTLPRPPARAYGDGLTSLPARPPHRIFSQTPFSESKLSLTLIKLSWKPYHVSQESKQVCKNTWADKSLAARSPLEHAAEAIEGPHALHPPRRAPRPYLLQPCKVLADGGKTKRFDLFDRDRTEEKHKQLERKNDEA